MISLPLSPKMVKKDKNKAVFEIEALYPGYGVTIGNALRRVLLSSLNGCAVTEAKIKGVQHEFSTISGVMEDVLTIVQNLRNLRFRIFEGEIQKAELKVKGEKEVKGSDLKLPTQMKLATPDQRIATLTGPKSEIEIEIQIEKGLGYIPKDQLRTKKSEIGTIVFDAIFTPIKNVSFSVENMRVGDKTDYDKLNLEVETDGTITPEEAFAEANQILIKHFTSFVEKPTAPEIAETEEKKDGDKEVNKIKIEELDLSPRTINAITGKNIKTVGGLAKKSEKSLLELEGMGEAGIKEVKKVLKKLGLGLKEE